MLSCSRRAVVVGVVTCVAFPVSAFAHDDREHIIALMKGIFDKPDNPLSVLPVVVSGDNAIASWSQGEMGGRALLWRKDGAWEIRLCSGAGLKDAKMLEGAGISADEASALASHLNAEESKLDPALVSKYDSFQGIVDMSNGDQGAGHSGHDHGTSTGNGQ